MNKDFSKGFMHDIADLLDCCMENETDHLELDFDFNGKVLKVDITFSVE